MASGFKAYPFDEIEPKWQNFWLSRKTFKVTENAKPKYYVLDMFPYPSASGLHVGHLEGYTATDIVARYKRLKGFNVLHPMGWDAFGLPAEQHALDTGTHPAKTTEQNVQNFKRQINRLGFSYDWDREVNTTDPKYYKWTQWIFRKLYEKGLAYEAEMAVNWCPALKAVLANEEVIDGKSERGNHPVIRKPMRQWVLKITAYAERLLEDLEQVDWPEAIKEQQRNWIGKSVGAEVDFALESGEKIRVFTTRPDTLFGATYMVLAPEHPLVSKITTAKQKKEVDAYVETASRKSDLDRTDLAKDKTGVFTGAYAINPVNGEKIPIWIADYVLISYGTGAIMAVPGHDDRDRAFAQEKGLKIKAVIYPDAAWALAHGRKIKFTEDMPKIQQTLVDASASNSVMKEEIEKGIKEGFLDSETAANICRAMYVNNPEIFDQAFTGVGICTHSSTEDGSFFLDGMSSDRAKEKMIDWLEKKGAGKKSVQYKLRDWIFSRQRYWGEPIPIVHCPKCKEVLIPEGELPIELPEMASFKPTDDGEPPLANAPAEWLRPKCPKCGVPALRETNTMPQWAGSCWYYLRFADAQNDKAPVGLDKEKYWLPVDLYIGGAEHAVLHLLYSRFWHKVLYDCGVVSTKEPFHKLVNQGMILGEDNQKMSKSRGNVVNPDDMVDRYGADSIRLYEMFLGPLEMTKPWATSGVEGVHRFLARVWRLFMDKDGNLKTFSAASPEKQLKILHKTLKKVGDDLEGLRFNTAISALMIFVNEMTNETELSKPVLEKFLLLLAPFAPHLAEELWQKLGHGDTLTYESWPAVEEKYLVEDSIELAVLVGGKVRAKLNVAPGLAEAPLRELALADERVKPWTDGKEIIKVIVVPGRTINIVVK